MSSRGSDHARHERIGLSKREIIEWAASTLGVRIERNEGDRLHTLRDLHHLVLAEVAQILSVMVVEAAGLVWVDGRDRVGLDDTFERWGLR